MLSPLQPNRGRPDENCSAQNLTMVEVQFLAWSLVMPRALLVVVLLGLGALLGRLLR